MLFRLFFVNTIRYLMRYLFYQGHEREIVMDNGAGRNAGLDGLRGVAMLVIVASHCHVLHQGQLGVVIFFVLSGFFAAKPFQLENCEETVYKRPLKYICARLIRILPIYYIVCLSVWIFARDYYQTTDVLFGNFLLTNAYVHHWFLQQILLCYLLTPIVMLFLGFIFPCKKHQLLHCSLCAVFLLICAFLVRYYLTIDVFYLNGSGQKKKFLFDEYLIGMAFAYLYKVIEQSKTDIEKPWLNISAQMYSGLFFLFIILSSSQVLGRINEKYLDFSIGVHHPLLCSFLSGFLIICIITYPKGIINCVWGNRLFAYVGTISFSVYLIHVYLYFGISKTGNVVLDFICISFISIAVCGITYKYIEKPSIKASKEIMRR